MKPKFPPEYYEIEMVGKISLDRPLPDGYFATGCSPFIQAIIRKTNELGTADFSDLYRAIVREFEIAPDNRETLREIKELVDWMSGEPGILVFHKRGGKTFYKVGAAPSCFPPLIAYRKRVHVIDDQICEVAEKKGVVTYGDIKSYVMDSIKWLTDEGYLTKRIKSLERSGNLTKFEGHYKFIKRPEPW